MAKKRGEQAVNRYKIPDWIIIDATTQTWSCLRCLKEEPVKLPALASSFILRGKAFGEEHRFCKEPA